MTSSPTTAVARVHKFACSDCARRKIKCDKGDPCSNCSKAQIECSYEAPAPQKPRKRAADEELLLRLNVYEELLRKHNIDYDSHVNTWIKWDPEIKFKDSVPKGPVPAVVARYQNPGASKDVVTNVQVSLWSNLSPELKYPPTQTLRHRDDPVLSPTPPLQSIFTITQPLLHVLHPEPRHIYRFWQIFVESVNPLLKIVHVPTLQQRIMDASWNVSHISTSLTAIMFAIYTLVITSMSPTDCEAAFRETRGNLLTRYRVATLRALAAADFLTTTELEVVQALVLFLFADPDSSLAFTLTGVIVRLGQKMGLHKESHDPKISFFEKEMRIRLWWQLCLLDSRIRSITLKPPPSELGDIRLPLNINDADLHPDMIEPPVEHKGPTEMMFVLMRFEVSNWLRSSPIGAKTFQNIFRDESINEIEAIYYAKYLRHCDEGIPLHVITRTTGNLAIARLRFSLHHPRGRAPGNGGVVYMNKEESDLMFECALTSMEMVDVGMLSGFSPHLFTHLTSRGLMDTDTYAYVISELRQRCSGDRVTLAWKLVEKLYKRHPELIEDVENSFFAALGDLTLEAWEVRKEELVRRQGAREADITPRFIDMLKEKKGNRNRGVPQVSPNPDPYSLDDLQLLDDNGFDWEYWNDFLQL